MKQKTNSNIDDTKFLIEPQIHSHITDCLDESHPLSYEDIYCDICDFYVHNDNNKCMQAWVETGKGNYCFDCFVDSAKEEKNKIRLIETKEFGLLVGNKEEENSNE